MSSKIVKKIPTATRTLYFYYLNMRKFYFVEKRTKKHFTPIIKRTFNDSIFNAQ